jgi:hypothetical protein
MQVRIYPEYFDPRKLTGRDVEVFARLVGHRSRMSLLENGVEKLSYEKMGSDAKCCAGAPDQPVRVFRHCSVAMGLLCCRDFNNIHLSQKLKAELDASGCHNKIILVSAEMSRGAGWVDEEKVTGFLGYAVVLSNGGDGMRSFIADVEGCKTFNSPVTIDAVTFQIVDGKERIVRG